MTKTPCRAEMFAGRRKFWLLSVTAGLFLSLSCTVGCGEIGGGAVELSWALRNFEGNRIALCDDARVQWIRLSWRDSAAVDDGAGDVADGTIDFTCEENRGITGFDVPPGRQLLWIEPVCEGSADPPTGPFQVPAPVAREVTAGTVVTLDAVLVVADECDTCPTGAPASCTASTGVSRVRGSPTSELR